MDIRNRMEWPGASHALPVLCSTVPLGANFLPIAVQPELENAWKIELDHRPSKNLHVGYYPP
jgi:hypothetical protein